MVNTISLIGLGYIGKIHLKILKENPLWNLAGIYDIDRELTANLASQYGVKAFASLDEAIEQGGAVDIVTPNSTHFDIARKAIMNGKHVFIEKPVTTTLKEAKQLQNLVREAGVVFQISRVERFNPAFVAASPFLANPAFIEVHRMAQYNQRGTDVSVVLDLMMHDLDLAMAVVRSNVRKIHASGTTIVSKTTDLANVRVEFENGCVANITANRMAFKNSRKFRVFTPDNFVSINLLDKVTEVIKIKNAGPNPKNMLIEPGHGLPKKEIIFEHPIILPTNAINHELITFFNNIKDNKPVKSGIDEEIQLLEIAFDIEEQLKG
jgi:predicted dehydrogenase